MFHIQHHDWVNIQKSIFIRSYYQVSVISWITYLMFRLQTEVLLWMLCHLLAGQIILHLWSGNTFDWTWWAYVRHDWIPREDTLEHTKENSADISSSSSHLLHCEDSTYNMAALTSISGLQWKGGWIFSLLGCIPNKIQASARNLNSAGMALRI